MRPFGLPKHQFMNPSGHENRFTLVLIQLGD
ncbi:hypothetical protein EDB51_10684 [Vibrio crassostreae]|nr:hypothetical protein EDB51_10684 [Vibrio crassostreae]